MRIRCENATPKYIGYLYRILPPLPEQHRIVSKIEDLFALLDRIEAGL